MPAGFALLTLTALMPVVKGDLDCPSPALVAQRLAELGDIGEGSGEVVELSREEGALVVRLRRGDGEIVGNRRLAPGSCRQLAESAAVVVAAWHARIGETPLVPEAMGGPAIPAPEAVLRERRDAPQERVWALTVAGFASLDQSSGAPAARLSLARGAASGLRLGLGAGLTGTHTAAVAGGAGTWWRLTLVTTAGRRLGLGPTSFLEVGGQLAASVLRVAGTGFAQNERATTFHPGGGGYLHVGKRLGVVAPWLGVEVFYWPRPQGLRVQGAAGIADVPALEALVGGGVDLQL